MSEIRVSGQGVNPQTVPIGDLAVLLAGLDITLQELTESDVPPDAQITVSLHQVTTGSAVYKLFASHPKAVRGALRRVAESVTKGDVSDLPSKAREALNSIATVVRRSGRIVELFPDPVDHRVVARITPESDFSPSVGSPAKGETALYGYLVRLGGKEPKARLVLPDGSELSCTITEVLARELGPRLYGWVGLSGTAVWNPSDWSIESFTAKEILPYAPANITDAFKELAHAAGPDAWNVSDVVAAIAGLRGDDD